MTIKPLSDRVVIKMLESEVKDFEVIKKGLVSNKNIKFLLLNGKNHNPNFEGYAVETRPQ